MIIMVRLVNIKIDEKVAEADFIPEDSPEAGHIWVNLVTGDILDCINVPGYGASYRTHARQRLIKMAKEGNTRPECLIMWY